MKFKRPYTITLEVELAEKIEAYKERNNLSYTDIFIEGVKLLLEKDGGEPK